jgi:hypothetical protein
MKLMMICPMGTESYPHTVILPERPIQKKGHAFTHGLTPVVLSANPDRNMALAGLPIVTELFFKARSCRFGLSFFILSIVRDQQKGPSVRRRAKNGSKR